MKAKPSLIHSSLHGRQNTHLPDEYKIAHELCFKVHDVMAQLLLSGRRASAFYIRFKFKDEADKLSFEQADDIFLWLEQTRRDDERVALIVNTVFPAILSDMLHCLYEALETSRKGKLTIAYMLLRKPIQESLYVLESIALDQHAFASKLSATPGTMGSQKAGGVEAHTKRIQKVLQILRQENRFDPQYLAQLRYDKDADDGFDGICNKAIHLFTAHKAIATEPLNINFIFSQMDSVNSQWAFFYSRLPYLMVYIHRIVEHICAGVAPCPQQYLDDMDRRISALVRLWWAKLAPRYTNPQLQSFAECTDTWLSALCGGAGFRTPDESDLMRMADSGAYPGESKKDVEERNTRFILGALDCGSLPPEAPNLAGGWAQTVKNFLYRTRKGR
jgi:hypothetical protein